MTLSERALNFAIRVHNGQKRKCEPDKPYVIHSILVGMILKKYGYDDAVVASGFLHDVVEQTEYTIDDIARIFGGEVASLVMTATEADSSLSWKERKTQQIKAVANLPERNAAVVCADKIANIEDLRIEKRKNGEIDYNNFHCTEDEQRWFFKTMYKELSKIIDNPMIDRLYNSISDVFDYSADFLDDYDFERMSRISGYQEDLMKLKAIIGETKPYIIEFAGTSKSGKSSIVKIFKDFFENAEFKVRVLEEVPSMKRYKEDFIRNKASVSTVEKNLLISSAIEEDLMHDIVGDKDVLLVENSLFDTLVLFKILLDNGSISIEEFDNYVKYYKEDLDTLINHVVICYTSPEMVRERIIRSTISYSDYLKSNELSTIYEPMVYNEAMKNLESLLISSSVVDTTKLTIKESSLIVAEKLLPVMRKEYVLKLKKYLDDRVNEK